MPNLIRSGFCKTEMVEAYHRVKATGLKNTRLGNIGVFARTKEDQKIFDGKCGWKLTKLL